MNQLKKIISNQLVNIGGWSTKSKIIVIESDDWGSIRMPSRIAFDNLLKDGIPVDKSPYCKFDNLCATDDVQKLFEILLKHKDQAGNNPKITANAVMANPNFGKIKAAKYQNYYYETFDQTLDRFFPNNNPLKIWKEGIDSHLFLPQFHGREHLNVALWLKLLQNDDVVFKSAFEQECWGLSNDVYNKIPKSIQAAFDYDEVADLAFMEESISDGLKIFKDIFGFQSQSFIPNNYIWPSQLNNVLLDNGVSIVQGMKFQLLPKPQGETKRQKIRRYNEKANSQSSGFINTVRNVQFEPSLLSTNDKSQAVQDCINQIKTAFLWNKPAIISVHRINFCGTLQTSNRDENLKLFDLLLKEIIKKWPEVHFMDTVSLAKIIANN
jgi:hypothetical protein